jgi:hypothetical protein
MVCGYTGRIINEGHDIGTCGTAHISRQQSWLCPESNMASRPASPGHQLWHHYALEWRSDGCRFLVDDSVVLETSFSPRGPLGFVCWLDNQTMTATPSGRFRWSTLPCAEPQWLEIDELLLE